MRRELNSWIACKLDSLKAIVSRGVAATQRNSFINRLSSLICTNSKPQNRINSDPQMTQIFADKNRENFVLNENQEERLVTISKKSGAIPVWCGGVAGHNSNHERGHSQERVLEDGISHGSTLESPFEFSPVFTVFKLVSISVNWWLKMVLNAFFPSRNLTASESNLLLTFLIPQPSTYQNYDNK